MKNNFEVYKVNDEIFLIAMGEIANDEDMTKYLQITMDEYREIVTEVGGFIFENDYCFYKTEDQAKKAIEILKEKCADVLVLKELEEANSISEDEDEDY